MIAQVSHDDINTNPKMGLRAMKDIFDALYYKNPPTSRDLPFTFCTMRKSHSQGPAFAELENHPADYFVDYNEIVDTLEEEHLKRDVFTTIKTNAAQIPTDEANQSTINLLGKRPNPEHENFL